MGNDSVASAAGSHPRHRLFGQATPGPSSTLRPAAVAQGKKTTSTHCGKCYEPLDAKRLRYARRPEFDGIADTARRSGMIGAAAGAHSGVNGCCRDSAAYHAG
jgi:hypothetical protein